MNTEYLTQREDSIRMFAPGSVIRMIARSYVIPREIPKGKTRKFADSARTRTARFEVDEFADLVRATRDRRYNFTNMYNKEVRKSGLKALAG